MSAIAQHTRADSRANVSRRTFALGGGIVWIVLLAGLLAGVVAVNVAVLRLNLELDRAGRERTELHSDVSRLRSDLSLASATSRIDRLAVKELGLVRAEYDDMTFVRLRVRSR
jgi:cell division protein FtsL